jgi:hypothetical protein
VIRANQKAIHRSTEKSLAQRSEEFGEPDQSDGINQQALLAS